MPEVGRVRRGAWLALRRAFCAYHARKPASLEACVRLHALGRRVIVRDEPLTPPKREVVGNGAPLQDAELAELLGDVELGSWSLDADSIEWLTAYLTRLRPSRVIEFGSGVSTVALGCLLRRLHGPEGFALLSVEQDAEQAERTRRLLERVALTRARVVHAPLVPLVVAGSTAETYDLRPILAPLRAIEPADFVLVDGPATRTLGRYGCLVGARPFLRPGATFVLDDALRSRELAIARLWAELDFRIQGVFTVGKGLLLGSVAEPADVRAARSSPAARAGA